MYTQRMHSISSLGVYVLSTMPLLLRCCSMGASGRYCNVFYINNKHNYEAYTQGHKAQASFAFVHPDCLNSLPYCWWVTENNNDLLGYPKSTLHKSLTENLWDVVLSPILQRNKSINRKFHVCYLSRIEVNFVQIGECNEVILIWMNMP